MDPMYDVTKAGTCFIYDRKVPKKLKPQQELAWTPSRGRVLEMEVREGSSQSLARQVIKEYLISAYPSPSETGRIKH
jgi:hypothetical protein